VANPCVTNKLEDGDLFSPLANIMSALEFVAAAMGESRRRNFIEDSEVFCDGVWHIVTLLASELNDITCQIGSKETDTKEAPNG
jgi:hypothetical protein